MSRLLWFAVCPLVAACAGAARTPQAPEASEHARGTVATIEPLETYSAAQLVPIMEGARLPRPVNGVVLYRITYWTEHRGGPELASGLFAHPAGGTPTATAVWLSGTTTVRTEAPSMATETAALVAGFFAGHGFLLIAPDYLGLGVSQAYHPYLDATSTATTVIDLVRAVRSVASTVGAAWQPKLLVAGFSFGGFSTAVVQRAVESSNEPGVDLRGAAALAPPLDLAGATIPHVFEGTARGATLYVAYLAHSYANTYGHPLDSILTDDAARSVALLFDGKHTAKEIEAALPANPREIYRPDVVTSIVEQHPSWLSDALAANEAYMWAPRAPLRLYFGERDVDVYPGDVRQAAAAMKARGGNVELVPVGPYDHNGVLSQALAQVLSWFDELAAR